MNKQIVANAIKVFRNHLPNIFLFLKTSDVENFITKAYDHTLTLGERSVQNNFIGTYFALLEEILSQREETIRYEFSYFNYLLGEFSKLNKPKEFTALLKGQIFNFKSNNFIHSLGEAGACLSLNQQYSFEKYESPLENNKKADFKFTDKDGNSLFFDVFTISIDESKYEPSKFESFVNGRLKQKYDSKTKGLDTKGRGGFYVYPILHLEKKGIILQHSEYLGKIEDFSYEEFGFKSIAPRIFGSIQGTFFNLFSVEELVNPELIKTRYSNHMRTK